jgi:hypothetical protein
MIYHLLFSNQFSELIKMEKIKNFKDKYKSSNQKNLNI